MLKFLYGLIRPSADTATTQGSEDALSIPKLGGGYRIVIRQPKLYMVNCNMVVGIRNKSGAEVLTEYGYVRSVNDLQEIVDKARLVRGEEEAEVVRGLVGVYPPRTIIGESK